MVFERVSQITYEKAASLCHPRKLVKSSIRGSLRESRVSREKNGCLTDPARAVGDPGPAIAEFALEAFSFLQHPRSYLRGLWKLP